VPLFRPEGFLKATLPIVQPLFSRTAGIALILIWIVGLYFASRQWDLFVATFLDFLTFDGAIVYGVTLLVVKALHELGHAYTAARAGVRVNTMGIAFMVLTPILYTDVTDAWRLSDKRSKLAIDAAGVVVELALAGVALFAWAFLPEGALRSAAFVTATTSLIAGLAINLNPLMRFDGYHLLADTWQVPNLQSRSNALAIWWLREKLFGLGRQAPEPFGPGKRRLLVTFAFATWAYRFFLFLGIALLVYHMFFKALGVILFAVEIIWFIALPIAREIQEWGKMRTDIVHARRGFLTAGLAAFGFAALVIPWSGTIRVQGVVMSDQDAIIYAPHPARIVSVDVFEGQQIASGKPLVVLSMPDLDHEIGQAQKKIRLTQIRLDRIAGDDVDRSVRVVLQGELERHRADLAGLHEEQKRLVVRAPHDGVVRDMDRDVSPGEWLSDTTRIAHIVGRDASVARGYVSEDDVWRLREGGQVTFIAEDPLIGRRTGKLVEVVQSGIRIVDLPYLSSVFGGAVPSDRSGEQEIHPRSGRHAVRVAIDGAAVERVIRGTLHLDAKPESIAAAMWRRILQVLVREGSA
ncbi:MAG: HlyD family efflux transporter periplasmic adaptor subunit, partial [Hyphomicrobium sp.]